MHTYTYVHPWHILQTSPPTGHPNLSLSNYVFCCCTLSVVDSVSRLVRAELYGRVSLNVCGAPASSAALGARQPPRFRQQCVRWRLGCRQPPRFGSSASGGDSAAPPVRQQCVRWWFWRPPGFGSRASGGSGERKVRPRGFGSSASGGRGEREVVGGARFSAILGFASLVLSFAQFSSDLDPLRFGEYGPNTYTHTHTHTHRCVYVHICALHESWHDMAWHIMHS